jgi:cytochrome bd-type quinol oxidase subunit 2
MSFVPLREFPTFGRVATWEEWRTATAETLPNFLLPWFISQMVGFAMLWIAMKYPSYSRKTWGFLLILASVVNFYIVLDDPTGMHEFGVIAVPPLQRFIYSRFFASPALFIIPMAACQNIIGFVLMFSESPSQLKAGLTGAIIFFFGIAGLGIGSAFPSSLVYASTMMLCWPAPPAPPTNDDKSLHQRTKDKAT